MSKKPKGKLIIIGGSEAKEGNTSILNLVVEEANRAKQSLVITTVASQNPEKMAEKYIQVFSELGVRHIEVMDIRQRADAEEEANVQKCANASLIFFTGGDQLRITSQIGDTPVYRCMKDLYQNGVTIVGTSAGAAAMPETMLVSDPSDESNRIAAIMMASGLGFLPNVVVDSHFAERGRLGRLLGAVAQNPRNLGIGIDENTAIIVERGEEFRVVGSGGVYLVDGSALTYSSISDQRQDKVLSIYDVTLHVLAEDDRFDLTSRHPSVSKQLLASLEG